jgi:hypothetical protein
MRRVTTKNPPPWLIALVFPASIAFGYFIGRPLAQLMPHRHHSIVYAFGAALFL